jgi:hypothetical protein
LAAEYGRRTFTLLITLDYGIVVRIATPAGTALTFELDRLVGCAAHTKL